MEERKKNPTKAYYVSFEIIRSPVAVTSEGTSDDTSESEEGCP